MQKYCLVGASASIPQSGAKDRLAGGVAISKLNPHFVISKEVCTKMCLICIASWIFFPIWALDIIKFRNTQWYSLYCSEAQIIRMYVEWYQWCNTVIVFPLLFWSSNQLYTVYVEWYQWCNTVLVFPLLFWSSNHSYVCGMVSMMQ
jgi:hypothetical protein